MGRARKGMRSKTSINLKEVVECEDPQNKEVRLCITDLPSCIFIDILLRLPLNSVLICRCVCKTWRNLIKDPDFVKLHFSQAETYPLIRKVGTTHVSRILYFVNQPPKFNRCYASECVGFYSLFKDCKNHVKMNLDTKLKIPLHNAELVLMNDSTNLQPKRKRVTKLRPKQHKLNLINSCYGFICLSEPNFNDPVMVCNPLTGEFIKLPVPTVSGCSFGMFNDCGFGYCTKTNKFKVVRMFNAGEANWSWIIDPITGSEKNSCRMAEIHTLGSNTWKTVGYAPLSDYKLGFPTYLNGTLNWLFVSHPYHIASFDFDDEKFKSIPMPPRTHKNRRFYGSRISIGELRGCLCVCDASDNDLDKMQLWVMKSYGVESSWNLEFTIKTVSEMGRLLYGLYIPISYFKNGTLLFFHPLTCGLFLYDPEEKYHPMKFLKVFGVESIFETIAYRPSFITFKDAKIGDDAEVYNVNSRCGELKLQRESTSIYLAEEDVDGVFDFNEKSFEYKKRSKAWWLK